MEDSVTKKVKKITAQAKKNTNKKFIEATLKSPSDNPLSLENVIKTEEQAAAFMKALRSL